MFTPWQLIQEKLPCLAQVDNVEDDSLIHVNILHGEIKPEPGKQLAQNEMSIGLCSRNHYCRLSSRYSNQFAAFPSQWNCSYNIRSIFHCVEASLITRTRLDTYIGGCTCLDGQTDHTRNHWWSRPYPDFLVAYYLRLRTEIKLFCRLGVTVKKFLSLSKSSRSFC